MVRWEYLTIDLAYLPARTAEIDLLNDAGANGWELICVTCNNIAYLRRCVDDPANAPDVRPTRRRQRDVA
jgi:hypothetical protein